MSMNLQVKLLRVLQERTIDPVGSTQATPIDVRVIAATHKNVETLIQQGEFREDLFYRLNVMPVEIKALHERREDIPILFDHFAQVYAKEGNAPIKLAPASMQLFLQYGWPGNVRELSNLVNRYSALYPAQQVDLRRVPASMVPAGIRSITDNDSADALSALMSGFTEGVDSGPANMGDNAAANYGQEADDSQPVDEVQRFIMLAQGGPTFPEQGLQLKQHMLEIERSLIKQALGRAEGNVSKTARLLNLQRTTLIEKINKYGLSDSP